MYNCLETTISRGQMSSAFKISLDDTLYIVCQHNEPLAWTLTAANIGIASYASQCQKEGLQCSLHGGKARCCIAAMQEALQSDYSAQWH